MPAKTRPTLHRRSRASRSSRTLRATRGAARKRTRASRASEDACLAPATGRGDARRARRASTPATTEAPRSDRPTPGTRWPTPIMPLFQADREARMMLPARHGQAQPAHRRRPLGARDGLLGHARRTRSLHHVFGHDAEPAPDADADSDAGSVALRRGRRVPREREHVRNGHRVHERWSRALSSREVRVRELLLLLWIGRRAV